MAHCYCTNTALRGGKLSNQKLHSPRTSHLVVIYSGAIKKVFFIFIFYFLSLQCLLLCLAHNYLVIITNESGFEGCLMAQLVKHLTLDFSSGNDLTVICEIQTHIGLCTDSVEPAWDSLSSSLSAPLLLMLACTCTPLSLFQNK